MDLRETSRVIHNSKGLDKSYPKMYFLSNLINPLKRHGHLSEILAHFTMITHQILINQITNVAII